MSRLTVLTVLALMVPGILSCGPAQDPRPNILVVMVDDLGFSDLGCYGGEIRTPHIDALAEGGLRFSQFYNTAKCHSSRVSLLTGLYCTQAGDERMNRATTLARVLDSAGYFSTMTGKWHLHQEPTDFGFRRYWGHLSGATDFFSGDSTFRLNGQKWDDFHEGFYTTDVNVDYSLRFLEEALDSGKPFFHYIAFNAPHYPLQSPREDIERYAEVYKKGWDRIREDRFRNQQELGIFSADEVLPPLPEHMTPWDSLSERDREFESFRMSVYAAMVDRVDQNMGRLLDFLSEKDELDNTVIMFCSDNGGCPFERSRNLHIPPWEGGSFLLYDASWAAVSNTPLLHYKQTQHEGGISTPTIIHWPAGLTNPGRWERSPGHLVDIMATCLELGQGIYPENDRVQPLQGKSLVPYMHEQPGDGHEELYFIFNNCRALRQGDWKLVSFYGQKWELYDLGKDRFEQRNVAEEFPERVSSMADRWYELAEHTDFQPPKRLLPVKEGPLKYDHREWHRPELTEMWEPYD